MNTGFTVGRAATFYAPKSKNYAHSYKSCSKLCQHTNSVLYYVASCKYTSPPLAAASLGTQTPLKRKAGLVNISLSHLHWASLTNYLALPTYFQFTEAQQITPKAFTFMKLRSAVVSCNYPHAHNQLINMQYK